MEQHAIPQQISSYEFKLVGDMTLKQFLKAAVGIVLAVAINATNLIFFLKYPLMLIFGGGGLMMAFVPFQDRPLETWVIAFLRSIYSPTIYTYKKMPDKDWISLMNSKSVGRDKTLDEAEEVSVPVKDSNKVREFIESLPTVKMSEAVIDEPIEEDERTLIGKIGMGGNTNKLPERESDVPVKTEEPPKENWRDKKAELGLKADKVEATAKVVFGEIPMPDKPDIPNMMVGMVTNSEEKIVDGAIVEVQDSKGNPSRVLKTNSLGQFRTTTPLSNGKYLIITEKEKLEFDRVEVELVGKIVEPVKIKAIV
ncbi:PrgI family protein [Candidatus Shapirobacteria bacterium]|nr:PrgI family protein [Candidatus Shapirobacteria bacterium]